MSDSIEMTEIRAAIASAADAPEVDLPQPKSDAPAPAETPAEQPETGLEEEPPAPEQPTKPQHEPWYQQRIRIQAAKLAYEASRAEAAEKRAEALQQAMDNWQRQQGGQTPQDNQQQPQAPAKVLTQADVEARASQLEAERTSARDFNAQCNTVFEAGNGEFPDFRQKLGAFENLGGLGQHIDFVKDVIALPNGHQVLYALAGDLDQAAHVLALPARQQAMALATISSGLASAPGVKAPATPPATASKAPPPTRSIAGRASPAGSGDIYDTKQSMDDWVRAFDKKR